MDVLKTVFEFIKTVSIASITQLIALMATFFFFGLLLYLLARFTRVIFVKSIGVKFDIYVTGWIGTPVHELGHALFCIPFGHKITNMKLFSPNNENGTLGYVNHSYNSNNLWHKIGNFFIGFGPILFGSFVLYILLKYLVPDNSSLISLSKNPVHNLTTLTGLKDQLIQLFMSGKAITTQLFSEQNLKSWQFWIFIYSAMSIASHMELSPPDLKGVWNGVLSIFVLLLAINSVGLLFKIDLNAYVLSISRYTNMASGIFTLSVILSAIFFISSYILLNFYTLIRYRKLFHPIA